MKTKDELIKMMIGYKAENYPYGVRSRGKEEPLFLRSAIGYDKASNLYDLILKYKDVSGDVAEVGVWRGGGAILLAELLYDKTIYLFDTFEGLPYKHDEDNFHIVDDFNDVDFDEVCETLSEWNNIVIHKGVFPDETAHNIQDKKFGIVHIDTDMFKSYLDCLDFFYDKVTTGGLILLDDYAEPTCHGATIATNIFFSNKPETIQKLGSQYFVEKK